ncbi:S-adenosylmethionine synthase [bioreactor metagenome]|uniref:methionine adenosyltransferase n=1 Tax=bioreactor metagenome TaxID=1076179 RepID=A0A644XTC8_9ZZZZ
MGKKLFTSESVTEGHPDKLCDCISDAVLDAMLKEDSSSRVACECAATTGMVLVMGEVTTSCYVDIPNLVRSVANEIGYNKPEYGFDANTLAVITAINGQSPDIALGVDHALEQKNGETETNLSTGAGDQGMMFGFACDETESLMPLPIDLAHALTKKLTAVRKSGEIPYLRPDGKSQVTIEYEGDKPLRVDTVVISAQHDDVDMAMLRRDIEEKVIRPTLSTALVDAKTKIYVNPTGRFVIGGPTGDSGLTGRKIIVDTYGGYARHGGGCFSGKDPTKVDRSAAYMARYAAKNVVAAGLAKKCEIQLAYAIGVARPVSICVDTFGTGAYSEEAIEKAILSVFDFRPAAIIEQLKLRRPIYRQTAAYGHFGRSDLNLPWEQTDRAEALRLAIK